MGKRRAKYIEEWIGSRLVRRRVKDYKAIARWREPRERLFEILYGPEVAEWCADNNVAYYGYAIRDLLRDRARKIKFMMKRYNMTKEEAIEYLNEQLAEYNMDRYVEQAPELAGLDFHLWPRSDRDEFEENWKYKIYGTP